MPDWLSVRFWIYLTLVALAAASIASGALGIALVLAGIKAIAIGSEYMELRSAHRAYLVGYTAWVVAVVAALGLAIG